MPKLVCVAYIFRFTQCYLFNLYTNVCTALHESNVTITTVYFKWFLIFEIQCVFSVCVLRQDRVSEIIEG